MKIREERETDIAGIRALNAAAFEGDGEGLLVDTLRQEAQPIISFVAEEDDEILGHIFLSPVTLSSAPDLLLFGLAPMAVAPDRQRTGIGSRLVAAGLEACRDMGAAAVIVLGHPEYYPRFGFVPASKYGIDSDYDVPDEVFMVLELEAGSLSGKAGRIHYHRAFQALS